MVERLKTDHLASVDWRAFLLRPDMPAGGMEVSAAMRSRQAASHARLEAMAHSHGMEIIFPEHIANSRRALEATEYAREKGKLEAFHGAVFRKCYSQGLDIGQWAVLQQAARDAGLDGLDMQIATEGGRYADAVEAQVAEAHALGITGVPTYVLNNRYAVVGAQPYEAFEPVLARLASEARVGNHSA